MNGINKFQFIGELSVMDSSPSWHFDEESGKQSINNPNLNREFFRVPFQMRKGHKTPALCITRHLFVRGS